MDLHDETLLLTIRVRLERSEQGKIEWKPDLNGPWKIQQIGTSLVRYFEPTYQPSIDPYGQFSEEPVLGITRVRKRRTGTKAVYEEAQRMANYFGAQIVKETREPWKDRYNQLPPFFKPIFDTSNPSRWSRFKTWVSRLFIEK
jgi:hypothetical protein